MRRGFSLIELMVVLAAIAVILCLIAASCSSPPANESSITFVGTVESMLQQTDDETTYDLARIRTSDSQTQGLEDFTYDDGLVIRPTIKYAFRAWGHESPRHITEAIPIP